MIVQTVLGLVLAGCSMYYWFRVVRGEDRFRERVARRYNVQITRGYRGHWTIVERDRPALWRFGVEMLQLGYFMGAMVVWGIGIGLGIGVIALVERLLA